MKYIKYVYFIQKKYKYTDRVSYKLVTVFRFEH